VTRRFRLTALERLRSGRLAQAARMLGLARREVAEAESHRQRIEQELAVCAPEVHTSPFVVQAAASRRERLREDLRHAGERVTIAYSRELAAMAGWHSARSDLRAVEALHEQHRLALAQADARAEQRELDELAGIAHRGRASTDDDPTFGGDPL
jgi:flagellar biosynthesis chaperone FliJ